MYGRLLRLYGPPGSENNHWYEASSIFSQGKAAMYTDANSLFPVIEDAQKSKVVGKVGYALFPRGPKGQYGSTVAAWGLAMPKTSKNQKAAWLFMQWATAREQVLAVQSEKGVLGAASPCGRTRRASGKVPADLARVADGQGSKVGTPLWNPPVVAVAEVPRRHRRRHRDLDPGRRRQGRREQGGRRREAHHGRDREEIGRRRLPLLGAGWSRFVERHPAPVFTLPSVAVVFVLMVFPVLYTLYMSVHSWFASSVTSPELVGLGNFQRAFLEDDRFRNALWLTVYFTGLATALQVVLGVTLALLLNRPFRGKGLFRSIFLLPMVATPVAIALVWMMMYNPTLGVMNYLVGLVGLGPYKWVSDAAVVIPALVVVDTWEWTPLITLIALAGLATLPLEPYESAMIDGASAAQMFWRITLPLLRPAIIVALLFRAIDCLKTFDIIYVMTAGGPGFASETSTSTPSRSVSSTSTSATPARCS